MRILACAQSLVFVLACSTPGDDGADAGADANGMDGSTSCASLIDLRVNDRCTTPQTQVCFRQCKVDGCFCKSGSWACVSDFSCVPEAGPLTDAGGDDATRDDAGDGAVADAPLDVLSDSPADAPNDSRDAATDGPIDAGADG